MARQSNTRSAVIIGFGVGAQSLLTGIGINLFMVRILDGQEIFGVFRQVWLVINTCVPIFQFGIRFSVYYFLAKLAQDQTRAFILRCLGFLTLSGILLSAGIYLSAPAIARSFESPSLVPLLRAMSLYPAFSLPSTILFHFFIADGRPIRATVYNTLTLATQSAIMVVLAAKGVDLQTIFVCVTGFSVVRLVFFVVELRRFSHGTWNSHLPVSIKEHLAYSLPVGMTAIVTIAGQKLDKFVVSGFLDSASFGLYSVGAVEFPAIVLISLAASLAMRSRLSKLHHSGQKDEIRKFWGNAFRKASLLLVPIAVYLAIFSREVVEFLYTPAYGDASGIFQIYLLLVLSRFTLFEPVLSSVGWTRTILLGGIGFLIVDLVLNIVLVQTMGTMGPPTATVIAASLLVLYQGWNVARYLEVRIVRLVPIPALLRVMLIAAAAGLATLPVKGLGWSHLSTLLAGALVFGIVYFVLALSFRAITRQDLLLVRDFLPTSGKSSTKK